MVAIGMQPEPAIINFKIKQGSFILRINRSTVIIFLFCSELPNATNSAGNLPPSYKYFLSVVGFSGGV